MKRAYLLLVPVFLTSVATYAATDGCADKEAEILRQLDVARDEGNGPRIRGLETALSKVQTGCTEAGLQAERQEKIHEAQTEIAERKADLQEALADGDPEKIEKRKRKLVEAREELREAQAE